MFEVKNKTINKFLQSSWTDLYLVLIITFIAGVFILIPPFNQTFLRIPFALVLLLFLPGYVFIAALFPGRDLSGIERFTLSVGLSIAITVFDGFAISVTIWRFRPTSIVVSLSLIILLFVIITFLVRWRLPYEQRFILDIRPFIQSLKTKEEMNDIEKALIIALVGSIIIASGMLVYAKLTFEEEHFTALYILGPDGKAEGYQTNLSFGVPASTIVGIENYEHEPVNYTLQVVLDGGVLSSQSMTLKHKEKWEQDVSYIPDTMGNRSKLEFLLFKEGQQYRSVHLWVSSSIGDTNALQDHLITGLKIPNGNMEDSTIWTYMSRGNYLGNYTDQTYVSASHSYEINLSGGFNTTSTGDFGAIYQDFNASKEGLGVLMFDVKDSTDSNTSGNYLKQVLLNNKIIWEDDVAGYEGWEHVETLILLSQTNRLTLRVQNQKDIQDPDLKVWWDDIEFKAVTKMHITHYDENVFLGVPANLTLAVGNYETEFFEYDLVIKLDNKPIKTYTFGLENSEVKEWNVSFIPGIIGSDIKLEAILYKKGDRKETYRSTSVLISSFINYNNLETALKYAASPPTVYNSNMEFDSGWNLEGINSKGSYTNYTSQSPTHSFEMWLLPNKKSAIGDFGAIYQDFTAVNYEHSESSVLAVLSFDVKDSIKSNNPGNHVKQVLIDDKVIWEDDIAGDEGWIHVEIPVMLPQNHKLILQTYEQKGTKIAVRVWWDNIRYKRFTGQKIIENQTTDIISDSKINGTSYSIEKGKWMNLNGKNFKPFRYDDDTDTSFETLEMYFSSEKYVSVGDATYTSTVIGGKTAFMGQLYQFPNSNGTNVLPQILLDVDKETIWLQEPYLLKNGYTLTLTHIYSTDNYTIMKLASNGKNIETQKYYEGDTAVFEGTETVILKYDIDNIFSNTIIIKNLRQYSEIPITFTIGDRYGEFEITEISNNRIVMKNVESITINDKDTILDGWIKFDVSGTTAIPYSEKLP